MEATWEGAERLREMLVPVDRLEPHPDNPRRGQVKEIAASLQRFGQVRLILAQDDGKVIAGNHTLLAARELGWTHVAAVLHKFESEEEARAYLLADNRLGDIGEYDRQELATFLEELSVSGRWEGTGYTDDHLQDLLGALNPPAAGAAPVSEPPLALREVVLLFTTEQRERFATHVKILRHEYGLEGITETVQRALREAALRVNQAAA